MTVSTTHSFIVSFSEDASSSTDFLDWWRLLTSSNEEVSTFLLSNIPAIFVWHRNWSWRPANAICLASRTSSSTDISYTTTCQLFTDTLSMAWLKISPLSLVKKLWSVFFLQIWRRFKGSALLVLQFFCQW